MFQVTRGPGSYTVTGAGGSVQMVDNFTLADLVIDTTLEGIKHWTLQTES